MSVGVYRLNQRCCATCRWWTGSRMVDFGGGSVPRYVKAEADQHDCMAMKTRKSAGSVCPRYALWEKI